MGREAQGAWRVMWKEYFNDSKEFLEWFDDLKKSMGVGADFQWIESFIPASWPAILCGKWLEQRNRFDDATKYILVWGWVTRREFSSQLWLNGTPFKRDEPRKPRRTMTAPESEAYKPLRVMRLDDPE